MLSAILAAALYLASTALIVRYFRKSEVPDKPKTIIILVGSALFLQALTIANFWSGAGIIFGLANSIIFAAWLIVLLLILSPTSIALGVLVYPLAAISLIFSVIFPDTTAKIIPLNIAIHALFSITAYAIFALSVCQSVLLNIQINYLHQGKINTFINNLPPLQTMESELFRNLKIGVFLLSLSLISGFFFIDDFFAQHLIHKTTLSIIAWLIFTAVIIGRKLFGWRGKQTIIKTQIAFAFLILSYFGSKFVLERLLN